MNRRALSLLFIFCALVPSSMASTPLSADSYHLMELNLSDRTPLSEGFAIYSAGTDWWIPLGELSELLGLAIHISPSEFSANGYVLNEARTFRLDGHKCKVEYEKQLRPYPCDAATVFGDEIFILASVIEKWLPIRLKIDVVRSSIVLDPKEKLPLQLKREREDFIGRAKSGNRTFDPGYPERPVPYGILEGPAIDETLTFSREQQESTTDLQFQHSSQIGAEILGLESTGYLGGSERAISQWRLQLSRKDPKNKLLGPLGVSRIDLLDVDLPSLPLISAGISGKGFVLSSVPLDTPTNYEMQDFYGPLPTGWEVILYRNEVLIDRVVSQTDGRYAFKNVPLIYGRNSFKFSFYGPHGERRDEFKTFNISSDLVQPGKGVYTLGLASVRLLEADKELRQRMVFQYTQGLSQHFSLSSGFLHEGNSGESYGYLGVTGVNKLFLFFSNCAIASRGGKACEWGQEMGLGEVAIGGKYSRFFDYRGLLFGNLSQSPLSILNVHSSFVIPSSPSIGTTWEAEQRTFPSQDSDIKLRNRLVASLGPVGFNHETSYTLSAPDPLKGRLDLNLYYAPFHFRAVQDYSPRKMLGWELEAGFSPASNWAVTGRLKYPIEIAKLTYGLSVASFLRPCTIAFDSQYSAPNRLSLGLTLTFSLMRDPGTRELIIARNSLVHFGSASVLVFLDKNRNGVWDPGESVLPNIRLTVNQSEEVYKTNSEGRVFISGLVPYRPSYLSVSYSALNNPFWKPGEKGFRFFPRPSKIFQLQFPIVVVGAIDGSVTRPGDVPANRIRVQLLDKDRKLLLETKTDREGYYVFDEIAPGSYRVRIAPEVLAQPPNSLSPMEKELIIAEDGSFEGGQDFLLPP